MEKIYFVIASIVKLSSDHLQAVVGAGIFPLLTEALHSETYQVAGEAVKTVKQASALASKDQVAVIEKTGFLTVVTTYESIQSNTNIATRNTGR